MEEIVETESEKHQIIWELFVEEGARQETGLRGKGTHGIDGV